MRNDLTLGGSKPRRVRLSYPHQFGPPDRTRTCIYLLRRQDRILSGHGELVRHPRLELGLKRWQRLVLPLTLVTHIVWYFHEDSNPGLQGLKGPTLPVEL